MALIDNNQVEEVRGIRPEQSLTALILREGLIDCEVHFAAQDDLPAFNLVPGVAKHRENAILRLIDEDVAVGKIEDARATVLAGAVPARAPQLPTYLEGNRRATWRLN